MMPLQLGLLELERYESAYRAALEPWERRLTRLAEEQRYNLDVDTFSHICNWGMMRSVY